jgi:hypothetical protein
MSRKAKRNAAIAALAVGMGFLAWVSTSNSMQSVTFKDVGYTTVDATQAAIDFQVTREPGTEVLCAVKALDSKFAIVGWKVVDIPAAQPASGEVSVSDGGRTVALREVLRTESQSVSAVVDSCWIPESAK